MYIFTRIIRSLISLLSRRKYGKRHISTPRPSRKLSEDKMVQDRLPCVMYHAGRTKVSHVCLSSQGVSKRRSPLGRLRVECQLLWVLGREW